MRSFGGEFRHDGNGRQASRDTLSPHRGAYSASNGTCASANNCARGTGDEKAASAAEAGASQNCTAADSKRGNNDEHQFIHSFISRQIAFWARFRWFPSSLRSAVV